MMINRVFVWLCLTISIYSTCAVAQERTVAIRAGEHPTYSRLVIPTANDLAWELRTFGREATLTLPTDQINFLPDGVFDRIPRTRLLDLKTDTISGETYVRLRLGCDCDVSAKTEAGSLILDITDPAAAQSSPNATLEEDALARPSPRPSNPENDPQLTASDNVPADLAERLISQLNKAAEQGLIELNDVADDATKSESEVVEDQEPEPAAEAPSPTSEAGLQPTQETLDGLGGIADRIEQSLVDAEGLGDLSSSVRIQLPEELVLPDQQDDPISRTPKMEKESEELVLDHCIDDELLDVAYWADGRPYSEQVASLQARVFGEFDEANNEAVLQLARFYIFYGLGTEAKSLLRDLKLDENQSDLLLELANTVEGKTYLRDGMLDKAAGCPGAAALWRTAAIDETEKQPLSDSEDVIDRFSELPIYVRRIIGPRLVKSFINRGQENEANLVFSIIERAAGYHGDEHELRRADLLVLDGAHIEAEEIYWQLVHKSSETSADAAILLVQSLIQRDAPLPPNVISAVEALSFEYRGTDQGKNLLLSTIKAKAGSNNIQDAISTSLGEIRADPILAESYYDAIDTILAETSSDQLGSANYLTLIFENAETIASSFISKETKIKIASELVKSGLPNSAIEMLEELQNDSEQQTRRIMAEAVMREKKYEQLIEIGKLTPEDPIIASLTARSLSALGQHQEAIATATEANVLDQTPSLAWRAGDWDLAEQQSGETQRLLSSYMAGKERDQPASNRSLVDPTQTVDAVTQMIPPESNITLKYANEVKTQSVAIRKFLQDLFVEM